MVDGALFSALAIVLPLNSALQELSLLCCYTGVVHLLPVFSALEKNTGLKRLRVDLRSLMDESLSTAIQNGLEKNATLESLELKQAPLSDDNSDSWCRTFSFLRTNKALKSLVVEFQPNVAESCLSAFRTEIMAMLQDNVTLESLSIRKISSTIIKVEEYVALVSSLQQNMTLKIFQLNYGRLQLTDDEDKHMAKILKKNYALESLPIVNLDYLAGDVGAILRLNQAGNRYLIEDGSSVSRGVEGC
jgi:hypothetical protein